MRTVSNPFRGTGLIHDAFADVPFPGTDAQAPLTLLARCPRADVTPLRSVSSLASAVGVAGVMIKDERNRMGLGSFKALGAAYVIACDGAQGTARGKT